MSDGRTAGRQDGRTADPTTQPLDRSTADLIGVALGSIATGATSGAAAVTLGLLLFRDRLNQSLPLLVFAGILAAALSAWLLADALAHEAWRRGVIAVLAVFAGLLLSFLSAPADRLGGTGGLAIYALLLAVSASLAARYTRRRARA